MYMDQGQNSSFCRGKSVYCEKKEMCVVFWKEKFIYVLFKNNFLGLRRMRIRSLYITVWVLHQVKK